MFAPADSPRRAALFEVIFEARTRAGRAFDIALIAAILLSVGVIVLASVPSVARSHGSLLLRVEWLFTLLFTVEYLVRLAVVARPRFYARSFFGVVDLLAIAPGYLSLLVPGTQALLVLRVVRILRIFHVLELSRHESAARVLLVALRAARYPLTVFLLALAIVGIFLGTLMYLVEGEAAGITSIPVGIYWAVVTLTTLGYGDIVPVSGVGKAVTTVVVVLGYWVLAVPVGIVVTELAEAVREARKEDAGVTGDSPPEP
jgi:voltage-gated potassium channel